MKELVFPLLAVSYTFLRGGNRWPNSSVAAPVTPAFPWVFERVFFPLFPSLFSIMHNWGWSKQCRNCPSLFSWGTVLLVVVVPCSHAAGRTKNWPSEANKSRKIIMQSGGEIWQEDEAQEYLLWRQFSSSIQMVLLLSCKMQGRVCLMSATQTCGFKIDILLYWLLNYAFQISGGAHCSILENLCLGFWEPKDWTPWLKLIDRGM